MSPELRRVRIGYIPLTDCLPLVVARERGCFAAEGLDVQLCREASWASVRDKLVVGELDAAHLLAPVLLASTLGLGGLRKPLATAFALGLNGNAITVSNALFTALQDHAREPGAAAAAQALAREVRQRAAAGRSRVVFATVFPFSTHNYLLRHWLASAGLVAGRDIELVALPPVQMVENLRLGHIDGYCVGEPWNSAAVARGIGRCLVTGHEIRRNAPDKVLALTEAWLQAHPETHAGLLRALHAACAWIAGHRAEALGLLAGGAWVDAPREVLALPFGGELRVGLEQAPRPAEHFHVVGRLQAHFPWHTHAAFFLGEMRRWGQLGEGIAAAALEQRVFRPDIHRAALAGSTSLPLADGIEPGVHADPYRIAASAGTLELGPDGWVI